MPDDTMDLRIILGAGTVSSLPVISQPRNVRAITLASITPEGRIECRCQCGTSEAAL